MVGLQGEIFWINLPKPSGSAPGYRHPHVIIQNNAFNRSNINTVVVCALTTNLKLGQAPGNVTLSKGEANLSKRSIVNVSQIVTIDKARLIEKIGTLTNQRLQEVLNGVRFLMEQSEP